MGCTEMPTPKYSTNDNKVSNFNINTGRSSGTCLVEVDIVIIKTNINNNAENYGRITI